MIIHSLEDEMIPFEFGRKLFEESSHPKNFLQLNGSHNDAFLESQEKFIQGITAFVFNLHLLQIKPVI